MSPNPVSFEDLGKQARTGELAPCLTCVRRPGKDHRLFFGLSCSEHLSGGPGTQLLWVMRDPGGEVGRTGRLCMIHNIADPTSRNALRVLRAFGIGSALPLAQMRQIRSSEWLDALSPTERARLRTIFATNAVLHGPGGCDLGIQRAVELRTGS